MAEKEKLKKKLMKMLQWPSQSPDDNSDCGGTLRELCTDEYLRTSMNQGNTEKK